MVERAETNIWGKSGCKLPDGRLCLACCQALEIGLLNKPAGQLCPHAHAGEGCDLHPSLPNRPQTVEAKRRDLSCGPFFCSPECIRETVLGHLPDSLVSDSQINGIILKLIAASLELGQVTTEEAQGAIQRLLS